MGIRRSTRAIDRHAHGRDASHFALTPTAVLTPTTAAEVAEVLASAVTERQPVTFRSGGTSLSGQSVTDAWLVDTRHAFRQLEVLDAGHRLRVEPGVTVRHANAVLARYGRALGPDPASEVACTIGGVVANNSSGMACGTVENTYATLESMVFVLASGTIIDSSAPDADTAFRTAEPRLAEGLMELRRRVLDHPDQVATIRRLFAMKNTMGYGLNALVDFDTALDIATHLLIGSEGTLGFVADTTFTTVAVKPRVATGLAIFPSLSDATAALPALVATGFATIELMDATSLRVAQTLTGATPELLALDVDHQAALLLELRADTATDLQTLTAAADALLATLPLCSPTQLTSDADLRARLWHIRKGLYTTVAGNRTPGTTALLEDIVVPVPELLGTCEELTGLFDRHGYEGSVIFGHARDGNIHFMLNERFGDPDCMARYAAFTLDLVDLVLRHGGSLKAEHGTGRTMAPFVETQYGPELYQVMRDIKDLFDPAGVLNPGVILTSDANAHLSDLKVVPRVEQEVDRCVECGYCEPVCPSRDLTLTPRQRIAVRRALVEAPDDVARQIAADYDYEGIDTCAVDGMCATACPLSINTGDLVRRLRAEQAGRVTSAAWSGAAKVWGPFSRVGGIGLSAAKAVPRLATGATIAARAVLGDDTVPRYDSRLPRGGGVRRAVPDPEAVAVYLPACIHTMFGPEPGSAGVRDAFWALCERAEVPIELADPAGLCCGTPWKSKGYLAGHATVTARAADRLPQLSRGRPVLVDGSSCTEGWHVLQSRSGDAALAGVPILDVVQFAADELLPRLTVTSRFGSIALHPNCSSTQLGLNTALSTLAGAIADDVVTPVAWGCCGFAGDRGMLHPELTASATAAEAAEVTSREFNAYASLNRTCEIGLTRATGRPYRHILELVEEATR